MKRAGETPTWEAGIRTAPPRLPACGGKEVEGRRSRGPGPRCTQSFLPASLLAGQLAASGKAIILRADPRTTTTSSVGPRWKKEGRRRVRELAGSHWSAPPTRSGGRESARGAP
jgi:hypothetical protein